MCVHMRVLMCVYRYVHEIGVCIGVCVCIHICVLVC